MLGWIIRSKSLQQYIGLNGGGDDLLFNGAKHTTEIKCDMQFNSSAGDNEYTFKLQHTNDNMLIFSDERCRFRRRDTELPNWIHLGVGHRETNVRDESYGDTVRVTYDMLKSCAIYQFHDTSYTSPLKTSTDITDNIFLRERGNNLAAVLLDLHDNHSRIYDEIVSHIRVVLPIFDTFDLQPLHGKVSVRWVSSQQRDKLFGAHLTSDGTLRFMALVTLLCMPASRISNIVLLDEPELGLHPYAISLIAELIRRLATEKQVIVATQSPLLLNEFAIEDAVAVDMKDGATQFRRIENNTALTAWLKEAGMGEAWQNNLFGGNP